jgi:hypothetical protein
VCGPPPMTVSGAVLIWTGPIGRPLPGCHDLFSPEAR